MLWCALIGNVTLYLPVFIGRDSEQVSSSNAKPDRIWGAGGGHDCCPRQEQQQTAGETHP